jgi:signal transduction histidine kinase
VRIRSLRALTLVFLTLFLTATVGTGLAIFSATHRTIARLVDQRIASAADTIVGETGSADTATLLHRIDALARDRDTGDIGVELRDARGRRIGGNVALARPLPPGFSRLHDKDGIAGLTAGRAYVRMVGGGRTLTTIAETEPFDSYSDARIRIYLIGFGTIVLVVVAGLLLFAKSVGRRIQVMRATVDAIVDGDMRRRVPIDGDGGVFDEQARAFNHMLDRIADLMRGMADVSNDIAHDLRTPLARLHGTLATLERGAESPAMREGLREAIAQGDALLAMFAAVLRIAEVEGGDRRAGFRAIEVGALAHEVGAMMAPVVEDSGHVLTLGPFARLPVSGDPQLLTQVFINLIENALRHTPPGTQIAVSTEQAGGRAWIVVRDTGPGIDAADRATALRRFGRLDASRSGGGHGLGLSLAVAILRLHRGGVMLEDGAPGLRVVLDLPLS